MIFLQQLLLVSLGKNHINLQTTSDSFRKPQTLLYNGPPQKDNNNIWTGISNLWDEIIEVSTYGPSERKMLKAQREREQKLKELGGDGESMMDGIGNSDNILADFDNDRAWMDAFASAKNRNEDEEAMEDLNYDGYALQDLLLSKWGVSLDVDFQKIGDNVYCTVLPLVGYGSPLRSRHNTELDYLMHLQGVVEILHKYDNLSAFIAFINETNKVPKRGTDSVPFRLNLSDEDKSRVFSR